VRRYAPFNPPTEGSGEPEFVVLRHQLIVVRRQVARPRYAPADWMVLASRTPG
jgi:hypothetical protein